MNLPDPGSEAMVDLLCLLDKARYENARAWTIVVVDDEFGEIVHCIGPFPEAEQALVAAGEQDADWKRTAEPEDSTYTYKIVPLWGSDE